MSRGGCGERVSSFGEVFYEGVENCPLCGKPALRVTYVRYNIPGLGDAILISGRCRACGYMHFDLEPVSYRKPVRIRYVVDSPDDVYVRVIRSKYAWIKIPELGIEVKPGPLARAFISNIEGLIEYVKEGIQRMIVLEQDEEVRRRAQEVIKALDEAKEGKRKITIVIEDPMGLSAIIPVKEEQRKKLYREELEHTEQEGE